MKRLSQISILKKLVIESINYPKISFNGDINSNNGCNVILLDSNDEIIGYMKIIDFEKSFNIDPYISKFYDNKKEFCKELCDDNFFIDNNSVYLHNLWVNPDHRGNNYGSLLMNASEDISKKNGYNFATSIVGKNNEVSQNMNKKLGYRVHQSNDSNNFLYKGL